MTAVDRLPVLDGEAAAPAEQFVGWLATGVRPPAMLADDAVGDLTVPHWRQQASGADDVFALREDNHPFPGQVRVEALDRTGRGFLVQFEERWDHEGQRWYCREQAHCAVAGGRIIEMVVYCTGDWDEAVQARHAEQVRLLRP